MFPLPKMRIEISEGSTFCPLTAWATGLHPSALATSWDEKKWFCSHKFIQFWVPHDLSIVPSCHHLSTSCLSVAWVHQRWWPWIRRWKSLHTPKLSDGVNSDRQEQMAHWRNERFREKHCVLFGFDACGVVIFDLKIDRHFPYKNHSECERSFFFFLSKAPRKLKSWRYYFFALVRSLFCEQSCIRKVLPESVTKLFWKVCNSCKSFHELEAEIWKSRRKPETCHGCCIECCLFFHASTKIWSENSNGGILGSDSEN